MRADDYKYMQIVDAVSSINQKVNLIGVVVETSLPKNTKGSDVFCTVKIIDESRPSLGIYVNFFAERMENLPLVESVGDIMIVCHVVMKTRSTEVYALYNKKFSSFGLFEGRDCSSKEALPYQVSPKFHASERDKKFVLGLRKWLTHHEIEGLNDALSIKEIKEGEHFNLLAKILHVTEVKKGEWVLFVWDGTDAPPVSLQSKLEDEMENPVPIQLEHDPLPRDVLCTFPHVGTVLRMFVDQGNNKLGINLLHANRWVKFVNVNCEVLPAAMWRAVLMPFSKLCYLPDDDVRVTERQRSYDERVDSKWGRMPFTSFPWPSSITETDYPDVPFVTLMDVITHPEVTSKFKCVVRVVAIYPWRTGDFCSPAGTYRIRLTLEDPTARIHAFLYGDDGVKFFGYSTSADALTKKRNMLLGVTEEAGGALEMKIASRNPPWIQCCLKSYYIDKNDVWASRNYRIFATKFTGYT